ncbi:MAG: adenylyl-sulfate kinase [Burkholderiales bacterium]|nr:adenylyl-sulfate kinase [Burkholderiales bacterium]
MFLESRTDGERFDARHNDPALQPVDTFPAGMMRAMFQTFWFTGLSGAGKSTLAQAFANQLRAQGRACAVLDGDLLRAGLCRDLGFSSADRRENQRRAAEVAALLNDAGVTVVCALISPLAVDRQMAREIVGADRFAEIYLDASLQECEARDPKGLYGRARRGELPEFTGVSAPYEPPASPTLALPTGRAPLAQCLAPLLALAAAS